ncbi:MAG: 4-hydroxy-tetrahydrodipicolinate synthase [Bacteroidota bacterium]|nr:4-hydroxy-tetrahydrodipicolinate synthase [Bacteroidota bacterium]
MTNIHGSGVALITPFNDNYNIDYEALEKLINYVIDGGVDYIVMLGTTGESVVISSDEKKKLIKFFNEINKDRVRIVLGVGGNNTLAVINELKSFNLSKIEAILSVSPYYNKPTQEGIYLHYKLISEASSLPIILYNVPGRTASNIDAVTTLKLAHDFDNIIAIKEASGDLIQIQNILEKRPSGFSVLSGDDDLTYKMISMGANGAISVVGQVFPKKFTNMVKLGINQKNKDAYILHNQIKPIYKSLYQDGNPAGVKAALNILGICKNILRPPLMPVSKNTFNNLSKFLNNI